MRRHPKSSRQLAKYYVRLVQECETDEKFQKTENKKQIVSFRIPFFGLVVHF
jgi:hypothetical protein